MTFVGAIFAIIVGPVIAGTPPGKPATSLSLDAAITYSLEHHPSMHEQSAALAAADAQVDLAHSGYLPSVDFSLQVERGSGNVLRGPLVAMRGIPPVSGPPTGRDFGDSANGSAVGMGLSYDVFGLAQKVALVDAALADQDRAHAGTNARQLAVAFATANAFINSVARSEAVKAAEANVTRTKVFTTQVDALAKQALRPGADLSRARAELALASTVLVRAKQAESMARVDLAAALGTPEGAFDPLPGHLLDLPQAATAMVIRQHPLEHEAAAQQAAAAAKLRAADLQYLPRLDIVLALWARGSGFGSGALPPSPAGGLSPDTRNWVAGLVLTWPLLDAYSSRFRRRTEEANVGAAIARKDGIVQAIQAQIGSARAVLDGAMHVAENTHIGLEAARDSERQATARYQAGLASVTEVAEAQRLLAQTEIDDSVARLGIWSGKLLLAQAMGDLEPFLADTRFVAKP